MTEVAARALRDVIHPRNDIVHPRDNPTGIETFVGLEHIEPHTGRRIGSVSIDLGSMTGRKARFLPGDIVYGYLRPYLNKVWIAEFAGFCSVDQYVFVVNEAIADAEYVASFLRSPAYLAAAPIDETPGQLPRIRIDEVLSTPIPFPPLDEQRRIAARLRKQFAEVDRLPSETNTESAAVAGLSTSLRRRAFVGTDHYPRWRLRDLAEFVTDGTHQPPVFTAAGVPFLFVKNIVKGILDLRVDRHVSESTYAQLTRRHRPQRGDVLYSAVGSFGAAVAVETDVDFVFQRHIAHIRPLANLLDPFYLAHFIDSPIGQELSEAAALGNAQRTVTLGSLGTFPIPLPPIDEQRRIAARLREQLAEIDRAKDALAAQRTAVGALPAALLREVFGPRGHVAGSSSHR